MKVQKTPEEIDLEIDHIEYSKRLLNSQLAVLKAQRDEPREDEFMEERTTRRLAEFFKSHGFYLVSLIYENRTEEHYKLAKHIWNSRDVLVPFVRSLSRHKKSEFVYANNEISEEIEDKKQAINSINNLCNLLKDKEWITFEKLEDGFKITPALTGAQKSFVHYSWSEEVTLYLIDRSLKAFTENRRLKNKLFRDVRLKLIYTKEEKPVDMQLDLVAQVDGRFYIFETKSGEVLAVDKWVDRSRLFDNETNKFITCTANDNLSQRIFTPFRLFALPTLVEQFTEMLEEDFII